MLALSGIRRLVVHTKAIEQDDLLSLRWGCDLKQTVIASNELNLFQEETFVKSSQ